MGYRTAGQVLLTELESLRRRVTRVEAERNRLLDSGECGPLRLETFDNQLADLKGQIERAEQLLEEKSSDLSARHRSDFNTWGTGKGFGRD